MKGGVKMTKEEDKQWSANDLTEDELVDDEWIKNNTEEVK